MGREGLKMKNKILVAIDESKNAMKVVKYVADTVGKSKGVKITLFSVIPKFPRPVFKIKVEELAALTVQKRAAVEKLMERAKKVLMDAGIAKKNITVKIQEMKTEVARDILKEAKEGKYDTLAIGRRGLSATKEFFFGSISNNVIQYARNRAVWVVE